MLSGSSTEAIADGTSCKNEVEKTCMKIFLGKLKATCLMEDIEIDATTMNSILTYGLELV
jgi:hypothetical protein